MGVPRTYRSMEKNIISYNYTDIASGEGVVNFYAATTKTSTGIDYILTSDSSIYSNDEYTSGQIPKNDDGVFRKVKDIDFDLTEFKIPRTFEGEALVEVTWGCSQSYTSDGNGVYLILKIRKWDGTTETDIISVQTETWNDDKGTELKTSLVPLTVPKTKFKKGEVLRLTIEIWTMLDSSISNGYYYLRHDPKNRNGTTTNPYILKIKMPVNIDL